tara:strand:+ start:872 stop:1096 length:225 start_codon:yes stop_codon:yes gene_type:complete
VKSGIVKVWDIRFIPFFVTKGWSLSFKKVKFAIFFSNQDYVTGFLRPDMVRGEACPLFTGSVAIARKSVVEILA